MRRWRRWLAAAAGAGMALVSAAPAGAQTFHEYSVAAESSAGAYAGLAVTRSENVAIGFPANYGGCGQPAYQVAGSNPVYSTQWALLPNSGWVEIGTDHHCSNGTRAWYWGSGYAGVWYPAGWLPISGYTTHQFLLQQAGGNNWVAYVDSTYMGTINAFQSSAASYVQAGLESYSNGAFVGAHDYSNMQYLTGGWTAWSGYDAWLTMSQVVGGWVSQQQWRACQNQWPC